jgi:hypothetical protein
VLRVVYKKGYAKAVLQMGRLLKRVVDGRRTTVVRLFRSDTTADFAREGDVEANAPSSFVVHGRLTCIASRPPLCLNRNASQSLPT